MIRNIIATKHDGLNTRTITITCEVPDDQFDLIGAAKKAADAYCSTEAGYKTLQYTSGNFNWADFAMYVTNKFTKQFGFTIVENALEDIPVDWDEQILSDHVLEAYRASVEV